MFLGAITTADCLPKTFSPLIQLLVIGNCMNLVFFFINWWTETDMVSEGWWNWATQIPQTLIVKNKGRQFLQDLLGVQLYGQIAPLRQIQNVVRAPLVAPTRRQKLALFGPEHLSDLVADIRPLLDPVGHIRFFLLLCSILPRSMLLLKLPSWECDERESDSPRRDPPGSSTGTRMFRIRAGLPSRSRCNPIQAGGSRDRQIYKRKQFRLPLEMIERNIVTMVTMYKWDVFINIFSNQKHWTPQYKESVHNNPWAWVVQESLWSEPWVM